jgi:tRNA pseudouridine55 synthase
VRNGQNIILQKRKVEIFSARVVSFNFPEVMIEMEVSSGTYIRAIARDLAVSLGLAGYVTMIHRSQISHLYESLAKNVEDITEADSISYEQIFPDFTVITLSHEVIKNIQNGLVFPNIIGLQSDRKYLVRDDRKYVSLIEEREGSVRICANRIE